MQKSPDTCWPSPDQELLLRAALLNGQDALDAWNAWQSDIEIENLDRGSQRLLPLLWHNLKQQGIEPDSPRMKALRKYYRLTWGQNKVLFHTMTTLLQVLQDAEFPAMPLKGAALTLRYYQDYGLRPMGDIDLLVRTAQIEDIISFLQTIGWHPKPRSPEAFTKQYRQIAHAHEFANAEGCECDLHWHLLDECCRPDADEDFWHDAETIEIDGLSTAILHPADQLLHVCVHGIRWIHIPPLRWVADAMMILNSSQDAFDWDRLLAQTEQRHLVLPMRATLHYVQELLNAPIPTTVLEALNAMPASRTEQFEFDYRVQPYQHRALGYLPILWCKHSRLAGDMSFPAKLWGFRRFLQKFWGIEHLWQLPRFVMFMSKRRMRKLSE
ncbi:MAG: nucleotidyltransferase family protein [bacterium]|nr:nucleotidyltransferase family protein [bacterium]